MEPEEAKVKQVSSLSQSVPLPSNSPESENSQGHESESAWEDMMISLVGALYVLCGKFFCYPFARGEKTKQNSIPGRDLSYSLGRECSQRTSLPHCLGSQ